MKKLTAAQLSAEAIEQLIKQGVYQDCLPGYRVLAEKLEVSGATCKSALTILEKNGVISKPVPGKRRTILTPSKKIQTSQLGTLLIIRDKQNELSYEPRVEEVWKLKGGQVQLIQSNFRRYKNPSTMINSWVKQHAANAICLISGPRCWIDACYDTNLPLYCLGGQSRSYNGLAAGSTACLETDTLMVFSEIKKQGYKKFFFPFAQGFFTWKNSIINILKRSDLEMSNTLIERGVVYFDEPDPELWQKYLLEHFLATQPEVVILAHPDLLQALYQFSLLHNLVPGKHYKLISMESTRSTERSVPSPTRLTHDPEKIVRNFTQWIDQGLVPQPTYYLQPKWIKGDTFPLSDDSN